MTYYPTFHSPWWLLLLPLIPLAVRLGIKSMAGLSKLRRTVAIALRAVILTLLVLALAEVHFVRTSRDITVLYILDRSRSVPRALNDQAMEFVTRTTKEKPYDDHWGVVVFGRMPSVERGATRDGYFTGDMESDLGSEGRDFTDIGSAVRLAVAAFPPTTGKRIVLISDGQENMGDVISAARNAKENGISIDVLPLAYTPDNDILLERLILPGEVNHDRPFRVKAVVRALRPCRARVDLIRNGSLVDWIERDFPKGPSVVTFKQKLTGSELPEGQFYRYEVEVEPVGKDAALVDRETKNNRIYGSTFVRGRPMILVVAREFGIVEDFLIALRKSGIEAREITPEDFVSKFNSVERISQLSAVVLADVPKDEINPVQEMIHEAVRDAGVGLVMLGGEHSFGAGGYLGSVVEKALPVDMDVKRKKVIPNGALALIMHTCEFPDGNTWAKQIAIEAVKVLDPRDLVGLLFYDWSRRGGVNWLFKLKRASNKTRLYGLINKRMNPGDMPDFDIAFLKAHNGLKKAKAGVKHCIVISDGDPRLLNKGRIKQMARDRISISTIIIAPHGGRGDIAKMKSIATTTGGNFYNLGTSKSQLARLPRIFTKEAVRVRKALIRDKLTRSNFKSDPENITAGIGPLEFPNIKAYVCTTEKQKAHVALCADGDDHDPILAYWQYGLGRSVAWTSDVHARWAADWVEWPKYKAFWSQIIRWVSKPVSDTKLEIIPSVAGGMGRIMVDTTTSTGTITQFDEMKARVTRPSGGWEDVRLRQVGPGRYEGTFEATRKGSYPITISYSEPPEGPKAEPKRGRITTSVDVSYSPEFLAEPPRMHLLEEIATVGGGRVLDFDTRPEEIFKHDLKGAKIPTAIWDFCLLLALLLFPIDVFVRRVMIDWPMVVAAWQSVFGRLKKAETPAEDMARLLARKSALKSKEARRRKVAGFTPPKDDVRIEKPLEFTAAAGLREAEKRKPAPKKPKPREEKVTGAEDGFTSRLLAAKKRALKGRKKEEEE
ncbi:MAG: VWA domain-containing protein [Planctomycetota bacterium]|nr:MAG: VWA domain-containing protein [Planctomycetota bacterium]